jgi:hypothetical protein
MTTSSPVAIWSFRSETAATEVVSQLEGAGIRCSLISGHDNLANTWLFVSREQNGLAKETLKRLPVAVLQDSVEVISISEAYISIYAAQFGKRYRRRWVFWLIVVLWPLGFGLGLWWVFISLLILSAVLILVSKTTFNCPCCRKPIVNPAKFNDFVECTYCGIKSLQANA